MDTQSDTEKFENLPQGAPAAVHRFLPQTRHSAGKGKAENGRIVRVTGGPRSVAQSVDFAALRKTKTS